jgi:hypothetical protein
LIIARFTKLANVSMASANLSQAFTPEGLATDDVAEATMYDSDSKAETGLDDEIAVVTDGTPADNKKRNKRKGRRGPGKRGKGKKKQKLQLTASGVREFSGPPSETSTVATLVLDDPEAALGFPANETPSAATSHSRSTSCVLSLTALKTTSQMTSNSLKSRRLCTQPRT